MYGLFASYARNHEWLHKMGLIDVPILCFVSLSSCVTGTLNVLVVSVL